MDRDGSISPRKRRTGTSSDLHQDLMSDQFAKKMQTTPRAQLRAIAPKPAPENVTQGGPSSAGPVCPPSPYISHRTLPHQQLGNGEQPDGPPVRPSPAPDQFTPGVALKAPAQRARGRPALKVTRFLILSDTYDDLPTTLPKCDVVLHCGNLTQDGSASDLLAARLALYSIPAQLILFIAGNHDLALDPHLSSTSHPTNMSEYDRAHLAVTRNHTPRSEKVHYLTEGTHTFTLSSGAEFKVYASPFHPKHGEKYRAFQHDSKQDWYNPPAYTPEWAYNTSTPTSRIPHGVDIVMTHGPAQHILDTAQSGRIAGCEHLRRALERVQPRLHAFGHIYSGWGAQRISYKAPPGAEIDANANADDLNDGIKLVTPQNEFIDMKRSRKRGYAALMIGPQYDFKTTWTSTKEHRTRQTLCVNATVGRADEAKIRAKREQKKKENVRVGSLLKYEVKPEDVVEGEKRPLRNLPWLVELELPDGTPPVVGPEMMNGGVVGNGHDIAIAGRPDVLGSNSKWSSSTELNGTAGNGTGSNSTTGGKSPRGLDNLKRKFQSTAPWFAEAEHEQVQSNGTRKKLATDPELAHRPLNSTSQSRDARLDFLRRRYEQSEANSRLASGKLSEAIVLAKQLFDGDDYDSDEELETAEFTDDDLKEMPFGDRMEAAKERSLADQEDGNGFEGMGNGRMPVVAGPSCQYKSPYKGPSPSESGSGRIELEPTKGARTTAAPDLATLAQMPEQDQIKAVLAMSLWDQENGNAFEGKGKGKMPVEGNGPASPFDHPAFTIPSPSVSSSSLIKLKSVKDALAQLAQDQEMQDDDMGLIMESVKDTPAGTALDQEMQDDTTVDANQPASPYNFPSPPSSRSSTMRLESVKRAPASASSDQHMRDNPTIDTANPTSPFNINNPGSPSNANSPGAPFRIFTSLGSSLTDLTPEQKLKLEASARAEAVLETCNEDQEMMDAMPPGALDARGLEQGQMTEAELLQATLQRSKVETRLTPEEMAGREMSEEEMFEAVLKRSEVEK